MPGRAAVEDVDDHAILTLSGTRVRNSRGPDVWLPSRTADGCRGPSTGCQAPPCARLPPPRILTSSPGDGGEGSGHGEDGCDGDECWLFLRCPFGCGGRLVAGSQQAGGSSFGVERNMHSEAEILTKLTWHGMSARCEAPAQFVRTGRCSASTSSIARKIWDRTPTSVRIGVQPNPAFIRLARYQGVCAFSAPSARRDITISQVAARDVCCNIIGA